MEKLEQDGTAQTMKAHHLTIDKVTALKIVCNKKFMKLKRKLGTQH